VKKLNKSSGDERHDNLLINWSISQDASQSWLINLNWWISSSNFGSKIPSHDCKIHTRVTSQHKHRININDEIEDFETVPWWELRGTNRDDCVEQQKRKGKELKIDLEERRSWRVYRVILCVVLLWMRLVVSTFQPLTLRFLYLSVLCELCVRWNAKVRKMRSWCVCLCVWVSFEIMDQCCCYCNWAWRC
jgi:hypothetical protein